jgi:phosphoglycolate phosphatase
MTSGNLMHIFFDLDGTLTDSRPGIVRCYQHALSTLGRRIPSEDELTPYVGPPLASCFAALLQTEDTAIIEQAISCYRHRFERQGILENALYSGIPEALATLSDAGHRLYIITSKPTVYANRVLEHFAIAGFFRAVYGPELADRQFSKSPLVHRALNEHEITREYAIVVGDRGDDIAAARQNGLRSIGITWGYGSRQELETAGARVFVDSPAELVERITRAP